MFAAAFPGFVLGYYLTPDGTPADALKIYLTIAASAALSYVLVTTLLVVLDVRARRALPLIGGGTLLLYYWFGASSIATQWQLGTGVVQAIRALAILLVGYWLLFRVEHAGRAAPATAKPRA